MFQIRYWFEILIKRDKATGVDKHGNTLLTIHLVVIAAGRANIKMINEFVGPQSLLTGRTLAAHRSALKSNLALAATTINTKNACAANQK